MRYLFLISFIILNFHLFGQKKYEKESRLKKRKVPIEAIQFVDDLGFKKRIKWYKEEGLNRTSIEAKTKQNKKRYSIEFDTNGNIEDIEIKIKKKAMPSLVQSQITNYLASAHQRFKIRKIQIQYTGDKTALIKSIVNDKPESNISIKYEIVVKAKTNGKYQKLEYLFDDKGRMLEQSVIISKNTDNLEY